MEANYYAGIDISETWLDWRVNDAQNQPVAAGKAANSPTGIRKMLQQVSHQGGCLEEIIMCLEHTGPYGLLLAAMFEASGVAYVMVSAAQVQRSLGIRRGKSDPIDANRLAEYSWGLGTA